MAVGSCVLTAALACTSGASPRAQERISVRATTWSDLAPFHARLEGQGISSTSFPAYVTRVRKENARRVAEGDLDHLTFYLLQSTRFTSVPPIEPALSAKALVDGLSIAERAAFLEDPHTTSGRVPQQVRRRIADLSRAIDQPGGDARLTFFRALIHTHMPARERREDGLLREYLRVMRFVYEKEFVAQRSERRTDAIADLYRSRGLSTDTAVEAGFLVHTGLGIAKSLDPERPVRRVLIVGPGLDLAPRTALLDARAPESYQPWAVIDALLSLQLSDARNLEVVAADINPRVVDHLRRARSDPPALALVSEIRDSDTVTLSEDYRSYFAQLGRAIGRERDNERIAGASGHLSKRVEVAADIARLLRAVALDIVTDRLDAAPFDVVIATNILPYFDDPQVMIALANIAAMLAPGGVLLHNEARPNLRDLAAAAGLPTEQSRHAVIARVKGTSTPLFDSVWVHKKVR